MPIYNEQVAQNIRDKLLQLLQSARSVSGQNVPESWRDVWNEIQLDPGLGGGLVLKGPNTIRNIDKLRAAIWKILQTRSAEVNMPKDIIKLDPYEVSRAYLKVKYPKLSNIPTKFNIRPRHEIEYSGDYNKEFLENNPMLTGIANLSDVPERRIIDIVRQINPNPISEIVGIGGHELGHQYHALRQGLSNYRKLSPSIREGMADIPGKTAKHTFNNLLNIIRNTEPGMTLLDYRPLPEYNTYLIKKLLSIR